MARKPKAKYPAKAYLKWDGEGEDAYLLTGESIQSHAEHGCIVEVAEYKLVRVILVKSETKISVRGRR